MIKEKELEWQKKKVEITKDNMKLLIVTQKVDINDDVLGFFHDWIFEFSKHCEKVIVICLEKREYELPDNVSVYSLGKEDDNFQFSIFNFQTIFNFKIFKRVKYLFRFYSLIWKYRQDYDRVFVHMIPMYAIVGVPVWRMLRKKIGLWYAHGSVSVSLRVAEKLVDTIFTSTKEGCQIKSKKIEIVGQGVDVEKFSIFNFQFSNNKKSVFDIISIGRMAPIKDYEILIEAIDVLVHERGRENIRAKIIGGTLLAEHKSYSAKLKSLVQEKKLDKYIEFTGSVPYRDIFSYINKADLLVSTSRTGSLDKVMLEAMSVGVPAVSCNEAVREVMGGYADNLMYKEGDSDRLAKKIEWLMSLDSGKKTKLESDLREIVKREHSTRELIKKILNN